MSRLNYYIQQNEVNYNNSETETTPTSIFKTILAKNVEKRIKFHSLIY
jgi:hypothetical protein